MHHSYHRSHQHATEFESKTTVSYTHATFCWLIPMISPMYPHNMMSHYYPQYIPINDCEWIPPFHGFSIRNLFDFVSQWSPLSLLLPFAVVPFLHEKSRWLLNGLCIPFFLREQKENSSRTTWYTNTQIRNMFMYTTSWHVHVRHTYIYIYTYKHDDMYINTVPYMYITAYCIHVCTVYYCVYTHLLNAVPAMFAPTRAMI